jgi:hypothetical protein
MSARNRGVAAGDAISAIDVTGALEIANLSGATESGPEIGDPRTELFDCRPAGEIRRPRQAIDPIEHILQLVTGLNETGLGDEIGRRLDHVAQRLQAACGGVTLTGTFQGSGDD